MDKPIKVTNKRQFEKLFDLLKQAPELAIGNISVGPSNCPVGLRKARCKAKWEFITKELNKLGPPRRTSQEWQRVWIHNKANLKRKIANMKKPTDCDPYFNQVTLTAFEKKVADFIGFTAQGKRVPGRAFGLETEIEMTNLNACSFTDSSLETEEFNDPLGVSNTIIKSEIEIEEPKILSISQSDNICENAEIFSQITTFEEEHGKEYEITHNNEAFEYSPNPSPTPIDIQEDIKFATHLEAFAKSQEDTLKVLKDIEKTINMNYELNKKTYELQKRKFDSDEEYRRMKIELKKRKLQKLNMELDYLSKKTM